MKLPSSFSTRDLVTIAVISGLGGVSSTYIGYLANLVNNFVGTPFGAGQFLAGLHVFWILLARGTTRRNGSGTLTGLSKGVIELLMGSVHGVIVVLVSLVEGLIVDVLMLRSKSNQGFTMMLSGGLSTASNVFVFQLLFLSGVPIYFILGITLLAFASGVLFAGYFAKGVLASLIHSGIVTVPDRDEVSKGVAAIGYIVVVLLLAGSIWYYSTVYSWGVGQGIEVRGLVENPYSYKEEDFRDDVITVEAELEGSYVHLEPRNYTGVPLALVIEEAIPKPNATGVRLVAEDGYKVKLELKRVRNDKTIIVEEEEGEFSLVADNLDGSLWVRKISFIELI